MDIARNDGGASYCASELIELSKFVGSLILPYGSQVPRRIEPREPGSEGEASAELGVLRPLV